MSHDKKQGFTLIELMLAMAFISMLLLAIALTVIQIGTIYNQGLTVKEAVQASAAISSDLSDDISGASSFSVVSGGGHYVAQTWGGALCLDKYSYVWNYGSAVNAYKTNQNTTSINLLINEDGSKTPGNFARLIDPSGTLCTPSTAKSLTQASTVELLKDTDHDLAIHEFCIASQSSASDPLTGEELYTINYIVGTNEVAALTSGGSPACTGNNQTDGLTACRAPGQTGADLQYCTSQEFNLVVRTQNAVN